MATGIIAGLVDRSYQRQIDRLDGQIVINGSSITMLQKKITGLTKDIEIETETTKSMNEALSRQIDETAQSVLEKELRLKELISEIQPIQRQFKRAGTLSRVQFLNGRTLKKNAPIAMPREQVENALRQIQADLIELIETVSEKLPPGSPFAVAQSVLKNKSRPNSQGFWQYRF